MSEQIDLIKNKVLLEVKNIMLFLARYKTQLREIQVKGIFINRKYLWKRFCKLNRVPKKTDKWSGQDTYNMNAMTDDQLYRAIVKASGSMIHEMR